MNIDQKLQDVENEIITNPHGVLLMLSLFYTAVRSTKASLYCTPLWSERAGASPSSPDAETALLRCRSMIESLPRDLASRVGGLTNAQLDFLHFICFPSLHRDRVFCADVLSPPWPVRALPRPIAWFEALAPSVRLTPETRPDLVFEIEPHPQDPFQRLAERHESTIEFHGSPAENYHSILRRGLMAKYCKRMIYGDGLYFTSDIAVGRNFVEISRDVFDPASRTLSRPYGCLAAFEVLKHHPGVRRPDASSSDAAGLAVHGGGLPRAYIVAGSPEYVRLRALLVYFQPTASPSRNSNIQRLLWGYVFILIFLACFASHLWHPIRKFGYKLWFQKSIF